LLRAAWEETGKNEKKRRGIKEVPVAIERLISLAGLFGDLKALLDTLDSCAASGISEPGALNSSCGAESSAGIKRQGGVKVMTIHASKGLEFEHVFVAGVEEGIIPFTLFNKPDSEAGGQAEEEKRLLYVAMTRAKTGLWLSYSSSRIYRGRKLNAVPSRFLSELEKIIPLVRHEKPRKQDESPADGQLSLF
jgi:superfamily I DNA/RNA helicase